MADESNLVRLLRTDNGVNGTITLVNAAGECIVDADAIIVEVRSSFAFSLIKLGYFEQVTTSGDVVDPESPEARFMDSCCD